jgi:hypothetical protein
MRKWVFPTLGVLCVGVLVAAGQGLVVTSKVTDKAAETKIAANRIAKVTVYPNSALVTRDVDVPAGTGLTELVVSPLPIRIVNSSLYSEGSDGVRVLSTRFRTRQVLEDTREDVRKLEDEMKNLQLASQRLLAQSKTIEMNMSMIGKLENFTNVTTVSSTKDGALNGDNVITLAKYVMEQRGEKAKELVQLQQDLQRNQEQADFLRRKLQEMTRGSSKMERDAVIVVDRANGAGGKVRLNYLVDSASWRPNYKLRAGKVNEPIQVDYLAALVQQTGEDWNSVHLTLSTAQPMLNAAPPELAKLEVAVIQRTAAAKGAPGQPGMPPGGAFGGGLGAGRGGLERQAQDLRKKAEGLYNSLKDLDSAQKQLNESAGLDQALDLMKTREEVLAFQRNPKSNPSSNEGPSVTYHLASKMSVPSRNDEQVVEVAKLSFAPKYYYKAIPVLNKHVYRLADLTNNSKHTLLPGDATMYQDNDFVGRMSMPIVAIGEEFTAGFGVDPQLQIQREMMDKTREMQGGNQILTFKYRILVSSFKDDKVNLQVWDRLPFAEREIAGIDVLKSEPELSKDALYQREGRPNNLLRWDLAVDPNVNGERAVPINYEFRLQISKDMVIGSFLVR